MLQGNKSPQISNEQNTAQAASTEVAVMSPHTIITVRACIDEAAGTTDDTGIK